MLNYNRPLNTIAYSTAIGAGIGFYAQGPFFRVANEHINSFEPNHAACAKEEIQVQAMKLFSAALIIPQIATFAGFTLGAAIAATDLLIQAVQQGLGYGNEGPRRAIPA